MKKLVISGLLLLAYFGQLIAVENFPEMYNIVWDTPSKNSSESMPVNGHSIGCNVWCENGDLLMYAAQSGAWDENNESLKLGRFRFKLTPNPFAEGTIFKQTLKLKEGYIEMVGSHPSNGSATVRFWVETSQPVIHVDIDSKTEIAISATFETWRDRDVILKAEQVSPVSGRRASPFDYDGYLKDITKYGDVVEAGKTNCFFYHNNADRFNAFDLALQEESLKSIEDRLWDPLENRISGGVMSSDELIYKTTITGNYFENSFTGWQYETKKTVTHCHIQIAALVEQNSLIKDYKKQLTTLLAKPSELSDRLDANIVFWNSFWNRSYIIINNGNIDKEWEAGRNYNLFRYQLGGNMHGDAPTKFNGGNLTFDPGYVTTKFPYDPDFRRWGGGSATAQNQRLVYWPLLKSGDFDVMLPQFDFYKKALKNGEERTRAYWGHDGVSFTEQMQQSGLPVVSHYGFEENSYGIFLRPKDYEKGVQYNRFVGTLYQTQLEFAYMILQYHQYSAESIKPYLPFIEKCIRFYDEHYQYQHKNTTGKPLNSEGKLVIYPATAGEAHRESTNPADAVAGLIAVTNRLLTLPDTILTKAQRNYFAEFANRMPTLKVVFEDIEGEKKGFIKESLYDSAWVSAFVPVLYPLYPFDLAKPGNDLFDYAKNVWNYKLNDDRRFNYQSWRPGAFMSARLGMTETAKKLTLKKLANSPRRYPTFWGPGHDWVPDHNWGGSAMIALQEMMLQTFDKEIYLFPAWPKDWDVSFKLHAPYQTVIEVVYKDGKLDKLKVTPESRKKDIILPDFLK